MTTERIALQQLLEKGSDADLLREMIGFVADRLMALEVESLCGAAPGERTPARTNQRNGFRERDWDTRAGTIELRIQRITPLPPSVVQGISSGPRASMVAAGRKIR